MGKRTLFFALSEQAARRAFDFPFYTRKGFEGFLLSKLDRKGIALWQVHKLKA
jgi:hypothetical protein